MTAYSETPIYDALVAESAWKSDYHCCLDHECFMVRPPDRRHCRCQTAFHIFGMVCQREGATCSCDWCRKGQP